MTRLLNLVKTDAMVQVRNNLYTIGISTAVLTAVALAWLGSADQLFSLVPTVLLLVVGGTTFLYVGALIFFEKEQGTIHATIVSPVRPSEYLWSKIITLTGLATLEAAIMAGGAMVVMRFFEPVALPNILLLLVGTLTIGILYTLMGIILMVRYDKITDFLIPMAVVVMVLQLPFVYFWGVFEFPALLVIPTSAPAMLIRGAFVPLAGWEWVYGVGYTAVLIIGLTIWTYRAFESHIIRKVG